MWSAILYRMAMLNTLNNLPEDPTELRQVSTLLAAEVKALTLKFEQIQPN